MLAIFPARLYGNYTVTFESVCIHQMNRLNSRNDFGRGDSTTNMVIIIIILSPPAQSCRQEN